MADPPRLPDSPLTASVDRHLGPRVAVWRGRTLAASIGLIGAFLVSALAFVVLFGHPSSPSDIEEGVFPLLIGVPNLLLGLVGPQIALRYPVRGRPTAVAGALLAMACAVGHAWLLGEAGSQGVAVAYGIGGLVGDGAALALPVLRRTRMARHATATAIAACVLVPFVLVWESAEEVLSITFLVPTAGAAVLLWLLFTEPDGNRDQGGGAA